MAPRPLLALVVLACLLVAGCGAPVTPTAEPPTETATTVDTPTTTTATATPTPADIAVRNGSLVVFRAPDRANASYVWVLRWDDRANATAFLDAVTAHFDARGERRADERWAVAGVRVAVRRPAGRTVVVAFGARGFVEGVELTVDGAIVRVGVP